MVVQLVGMKSMLGGGGTPEVVHVKYQICVSIFW